MRFFDENGDEIKRTKFDEIAEEVEKINKNTYNKNKWCNEKS